MSNGFKISSFYGASQIRKRKSIENQLNETVKKHRSDKLPESFKPSICGPSTKWKTFFRQHDAFTYARSKSTDLHVFAFESETLGSETGQRMYLVASYPVFWHFYEQLKDNQRFHYEVIAEGAVCKLYFDLEFIKEKNPDRDGSKMVDVLIKYVCLWLKSQFNVKCDRQMVLDLDASTAVKFSRHLIFQLDNNAFRNNIHVGNFVHYIISKLLTRLKALPSDGTVNDDSRSESSKEKKDKDDTNICQKIFSEFTVEELSSLIVKDKHDKDVLFCDLGVYTKNRNFRLYKSSKYGKLNPLRLAMENEFHPKSTDTDAYEKEIFLKSLVADVMYNNKLKILSFEADSELRRQTGLRNPGTRNSDDTLTDTLDGYKKSPYPEIDDFISNVVKRNGTDGQLRHWTYFTQGEIILYEMSKYRWCENIQRQHKSNNVMLIVNVKKGVYYQKCHDPECRLLNFKSTEYPLPKELLPSHFFDEAYDDFDDDFDDAEILNAAIEAEEHLQSNGRHGSATLSVNTDSNSAEEQPCAYSQSSSEATGGNFVSDSPVCLQNHQLTTSETNIKEIEKSMEIKSRENGHGNSQDLTLFMSETDACTLTEGVMSNHIMTANSVKEHCFQISAVQEIPSSISSAIPVVKVSTQSEILTLSGSAETNSVNH